MPIISHFFGIIIRMYYLEHDPPHIHAEYQGMLATFDFQGRIMKGNLRSPTAVKLIKKWITTHETELSENWHLAIDHQPLKYIEPLL